MILFFRCSLRSCLALITFSSNSLHIKHRIVGRLSTLLISLWWIFGPINFMISNIFENAIIEKNISQNPLLITEFAYRRWFYVWTLILPVLLNFHLFESDLRCALRVMSIISLFMTQILCGSFPTLLISRQRFLLRWLIKLTLLWWSVKVTKNQPTSLY